MYSTPKIQEREQLKNKIKNKNNSLQIISKPKTKFKKGTLFLKPFRTHRIFE